MTKFTIELEILQESSEGQNTNSVKRTGKGRSLSRGFQNIASDIGNIFQYFVNLTSWKFDKAFTPERDETGHELLDKLKPSLISNKQLNGKFYFYNFGGNKNAARGIALLIDNNGKRVYKNRIMETNEEKLQNGFIDLDDAQRERILAAEDTPKGLIKFLKTNGRNDKFED